MLLEMRRGQNFPTVGFFFFFFPPPGSVSKSSCRTFHITASDALFRSTVRHEDKKTTFATVNFSIKVSSMAGGDEEEGGLVQEGGALSASGRKT